jgi:hypothetical protein
MTNPELARNLWLEITPHRLIAMPAILGLLFVAATAFEREQPALAVAYTGLGAFIVLTVVWGARLAANSILDELAERTWDWQRLSTLTPWAMTWGKLFGATAFAWYGGLIGLCTFLLTVPAGKVHEPVRLALLLVGIAVMLHAAAIAAALHVALRTAAGMRRSMGVVTLLAALYVLPKAMILSDSKVPVQWYGHPFEGAAFVLASAAVFALWSVFGAWRAMCARLAVRTTPIAWAMFTLFLGAYAAGFAAPSGQAPSRVALLGSGAMVALAMTYAMLFTEGAGPAVVRALERAVQLGAWRRVAETMPCWAVSWCLALLCALGLALGGPDATARAGQELPALPLVFLVLRDAGILMFFQAAPKPRRAEGTAFVYLVVLYAVLPGTLYAFGLDPLARLLLPAAPDGHALALAVTALAQAAFAWWLATRRLVVAMRPTGAGDATPT